MMEIDLGKGVRVTLLNHTRESTAAINASGVIGDARQLSFNDHSYDVIFSNSVIEHVGSINDQKRMAQEVLRVAGKFFVHTPNKHFPIEPHFLFPFFQFLPVMIRIWMVRNFHLGWIPRTRDAQQAGVIVRSIHLLTKKELVDLFPHSRIFEEKFFGITKSFIVYGGWEA